MGPEDREVLRGGNPQAENASYHLRVKAPIMIPLEGNHVGNGTENQHVGASWLDSDRKSILRSAKRQWCHVLVSLTEVFGWMRPVRV